MRLTVKALGEGSGRLLGGDQGRWLSAPGLRRQFPDLADRDVYLCGPPGMADAVGKNLRDAGLPPAQLHEERFVF